MGQKKRAAAARHFAPPSNGGPAAPPPPPSLPLPLDNAGSPAPVDVEQCHFGSVAGGYLTNGGPVGNGGAPEGPKAGGEELQSCKGDCEKALVALRRGNSTKALKLIRDACNRFDTSALVQRVRGHICMRLASVIEDLTTKQRHLKEAIEAARKAVSLSPQSVEYALFHAQLLFEAATDSKGYEEVVQECQRALAIQDPVDPAKESLHEEAQHKLPTPEARIAHAQQELRSLVQKANIASISNWMKTLGNGASEEKLRFIHMRKLVEDPMEQRVSQPKRPHEVKKSVKTPEERRKEIEVRVAAARLLQEKRECSPPHPEDGASSSPKVGVRLGGRKSSGSHSKKLGQAFSAEHQIERLKPFWNSFSSQERQTMLEVSIQALQNHLGSSSKTSLSTESFVEALEFAQEKKTWRFWTCCSCSERFIDCQEHAQHIMQEHIDNLPQKLRRLLPGEIDQDMIDQILDEDCRPFDGPAAIKMLIESSDAVIHEESAQEHTAVSNAGFDCCSDASDASTSSRESRSDDIRDALYQCPPNVARDSVSAETSLNAVLDEDEEQALDRNSSHMCNGECQRPKTIQRLVKEMPTHELPYADDDERAKLLQRIRNLFRILIVNKCLATDHMEKIVHYATDELQGFVPDTSVQYEFNHSPLYIRFLPAQQLRRILRYLRELINACGLDQLSEHGSPPAGSQNEDEDVIQDRLFLTEDFTTLALDERLLKDTSAKSVETPLTDDSDKPSKQQALSKEMDALCPLLTVKGGESMSHADLQLAWIYGTAEHEYQPAGWKQFREERAQQGRDVFRALKKEFHTLQSLCERKREHLHYQEVVYMAERLCIEELKKREQKLDGSCQSHEAVLKKRQQELLEGRAGPNGLSPLRKLELDVITTILREAQTANSPQFTYDGTLSMTTSRLSDSDEEDEDAWRVQEFIRQTDSCIEVVIQRQKDDSTSEVNKLDARILRAMDSVQKLEHKLGNVSVLDYRAVVLPLVKSFLKARLEDAAEKDALQKSDAVREAFLAELSRDENTTTERVPDSSRHLKDKSKDKKKSKEQRKSKDGKRVPSGGSDIQQRNIMNGSLVDHVGDNTLDDEDGLDWDSIEETRQEQEAERRRQAELEAEERKLAETLELQCNLEAAAKEKHLAELKKKQAEKDAKASPILKNSLGLDSYNASSQNNSSCWQNLPPDLLSQHQSKDVSYLESDSLVVQDALFNDVIDTSNCVPSGSTHPRNTENFDYFPLQLTGSLPSEGVHLFSREGVKDCVRSDLCARPVESDAAVDCEDSFSKAIVLHSSENLALNSSKPKKSGKNKRKKIARTQEDSNHTLSSEEQSLDSTRKDKHSSDKDGASLDNVGRTTHNSSKTLRQLKDEQDAEDRFQEDLEKAMRQSLADVVDPSPEISQGESMKNDPLASAVSDNLTRNRSGEIGKGLQNESGQYNCFLNAVIQSLWHLQKFREELLAASSSNHMHFTDPCVVCALREIFVGLNTPMSETSNEAIAPTALRVALSTVCSQKEIFQEAQMNDASEVLGVIFDCLHKAFTLNAVPETSSDVGFWKCHETTPCIAHSLFGLDIAMQMNCQACGKESRHLKYTSFFHNINASSLRTAKIMYQESCLDELLKLVEMNHHLACDMEMGGCGRQNYIHHLLRAAPHVFTTVVGWQNNRENVEDISATVDAIDMDVDVGIVYRGLDEGFKHRLVSVICYYGQHYHCFAFNNEFGKWVMFDDTTVKVVGSWDDVADACRRGHLQPQVLFYEALPR